MVDVDDAPVVVFQRGSHHHIVVGILIEVPNGGNGGAESGVLVTMGILQRSIVNKPVLQNQGQEKAQGDLARSLRVMTHPGLHHPFCVSLCLSRYRNPRTEELPLQSGSAGMRWPPLPSFPHGHPIKAWVRCPWKAGQHPRAVPVSGCRRTPCPALRPR